MTNWSDAEADSDEEVQTIKDDKLLCDLHLNSPLNIDFIKTYCGEMIKYRMFPDKKVKTSAAYGRQQMRGVLEVVGMSCETLNNPSPGCIPVKVELSSLSNEEESWIEPELPIILQHIHDAFKGRGLNTKFSLLADGYRREKITSPKGLARCFQDIMTLCLGVSEMLRGGSYPESLKGNCGYIDRWTYVRTHSCSLTPVLIITDGTTVHMVMNNIYYLTSWEDLLAILDTLGQRISAFTAQKQALLISEPGGIESEVHKRIIKIFDDVLRRYGNKGYKMIGMFETLCVSQLLRKNPDDINDPLMLTMSLYSELEDISKELGTSSREVREAFDDAFEVLATLDNFQLSNIFCEYRIWGHPYVDVYAGMKKVHSIGTKKKKISGYIPTQMVRIFKETVITGYHKKKGRYPKALVRSIPKRVDGYIASAIKGNRTIEKYAPGYIIEDWDDIELCEMFPIPTTYDITHILNDKAISPKLNDLVKAVEDGVSLDRMEGRRGILAWLQGHTINCRDLLQEISRNGISREDSVIGMYEKEREMKIEARMFALMSEIMRYYFVITEGLIADNLLEFFPQITMKDSLNKLQKRLWTAGTKMGGEYDVNINIDFSKWNTNMRAELMTPLFHQMDKLFGLDNVISRTHDIFTNSLIYSCSGKYLPQVIDGEIAEDAPMCYRGHLGGMEGLRQKGWTIGTVCLIEYVARIVRTKYNLMGQGDNQIIKLRMNERKWRDYEWTHEEKIEEAKKIALMFMQTLEDTFNEVGLPVKPKECWMSHKLFMYGKAMLLENMVLSQWNKKILRSYALSNEGVLTIGGTIGTISSNCMSSCASMENPELGYGLYLQMGLWTLRFLTRYHPFARIQECMSSKVSFRFPGRRKEYIAPSLCFHQFAALFLLIPSICGGSTNIPFTTYIMRGFPDPASEAYSWLKLLSEGPDKQISYISSCFYSYIAPAKIDIEQLSVSPLGINHVRVLSPALSAKKESLELIRSNYGGTNNIVECEWIVSQAYADIPVTESLITDPVNPLILSEIVSLYPHSLMSDLMSRIQSTSTIKKLAVKKATVPIIKRIQAAEESFIGYMRWRGSQMHEVYSLCATRQVRVMRNIGWGREIVGVTTPHPLECMKIGCADAIECRDISDYIYILRDDSGGFSPYLGSSVKNKVQSVGDIAIRNEPLTKGISRMAAYANWLGLGKNYKALIAELGRLYGGENIVRSIESEYAAEGNYTGSMDHRLRTGTMAEGCFINYAPQVGSKIFMSTDNMMVYGRGNTNHTLQFQACFCWGQMMSQRTAIQHHGHAHIVCTDCVIPVNDNIPDIENVLHTVVKSTGEPIKAVLGIRESSPVLLEGEDDELLASFIRCAKGHDKFKEKYLRLSLTIALAIKVSKELMMDALEDVTEVGTEIADLQKYPRIYGKKIFVDELLEYTGIFCIIRGCIHKRLAADGVSLYKVKRYIIDRLSHLSYNKIAGLGSLIIDDNIQDYPLYLNFNSTGTSYPTTIKEHMLGGICTLKRMIQSIGAITSVVFPKTIDIPILDIKADDLAMYILALDLSHNKCGKMLSIYTRSRNGDDLMRESCSIHHAKKILRCLQPIYSSIDKMFKSLSTITTVPSECCPMTQVFICPAHTLLTGTLSKQNPRDRGYRGPINYSNKNYREITLPTASVYKWEEFQSCIPIKKYNIVLGDGTGTSSYTLAVNNPSSIFFPMALLEQKSITPQDLNALTPPMSKWVPNVSRDAILHVRDNIDSNDFLSSLKTFLSKFRKEEVTIISDIEMRGGSILSSPVLFPLVDLGYSCALKGYLEEFRKNDQLCNLTFSKFDVVFSTMGNIEYGELLIVVQKGTEYINTNDIYLKYEEHRAGFCEDSIPGLMKHISDRHPYLREMSINQGIRYLEQLGWSVTREMLSMDWETLSMYFMVYINNHYLFAGESGSRARVVSPRKRREIERLFQILLLITTTRDYPIVYLESLKLLHRKDGITPKYKYCKGFFSIDEYSTELKSKDRQTANCLWNYRKRKNVVMRNCFITSKAMSENSNEILGIFNTAPIGEAMYLCSTTFETGSDITTESEP